MLLTGELIDAAGATARPRQPRRAGRRACTRRMALARQIAAKSALTVKIGKEAFYRQREMPLADAYGYASEVMVREHAGARRGRGHRRLSGKAGTELGRPLRQAQPADLVRLAAAWLLPPLEWTRPCRRSIRLAPLASSARSRSTNVRLRA